MGAGTWPWLGCTMVGLPAELLEPLVNRAFARGGRQRICQDASNTTGSNRDINASTWAGQPAEICEGRDQHWTAAGAGWQHARQTPPRWCTGCARGSAQC